MVVHLAAALEKCPLDLPFRTPKFRLSDSGLDNFIAFYLRQVGNDVNSYRNRKESGSWHMEVFFTVMGFDSTLLQLQVF